MLNQTFVADKGVNAIARAATIKINTDDGSINQRLRYYEDVVTHVTKNRIGVGIGNWVKLLITIKRTFLDI